MKLILISLILLALMSGIGYAVISSTGGFNLGRLQQFGNKAIEKPTKTDTLTSVLAASSSPRFIFTANIESFFRENVKFNKDVDVKGRLTASNLIDEILAGDGIDVSGTIKNPIIVPKVSTCAL